MTRALPYLPLFLALSTSSPFWEGQLTGLKGYRLAAYDELPRTGLPDLFVREQDCNTYIDAMIKSGAIADASQVWWSVRPSLKYPTLELRIADSCTSIDDAVALAALYRALIRHLYLHPEHNGRLTAVDRALASENKWRAQRYGTEMSFVSREGPIPIAEFLDDMCDQIAPDIEAGLARYRERSAQLILRPDEGDAAVVRGGDKEGVERCGVVAARRCWDGRRSTISAGCGAPRR